MGHRCDIGFEVASHFVKTLFSFWFNHIEIHIYHSQDIRQQFYINGLIKKVQFFFLLTKFCVADGTFFSVADGTKCRKQCINLISFIKHPDRAINCNKIIKHLQMGINEPFIVLDIYFLYSKISHWHGFWSKFWNFHFF